MRSPFDPTHPEEGASSIEYAILASLIAAVIVTIVYLLGPEVAKLYHLPPPF